MLKGVSSHCPRYGRGNGCDTSEGDSFGRDPCTNTRGWIDGERCAYYSKKGRIGLMERIFGRIEEGIEEMEGIKED